MYSQSLKSDGAVVGLVAVEGQDNNLNGEEAFDNTQANECLVFQEYDENGEIIENIAVATLNDENGDLVWSRAPDKDTIHRKTISMSQMASMLKDKDRNNVYENAIKESIHYFTQKTGYSPSMLDIGSGTGLLSCMSAIHGATSVIGFEMFPSLAHVAESVIKTNQLDHIISIQACKSTEAEIGNNSDNNMDNNEHLADLLVSELLDTALIGESCIFSHLDAMKRLMKPCHLLEAKGVYTEDRVIPHSGYMTACFIQGK